MYFRIEIFGDKLATLRLKRIGEHAANPAPAMIGVLDELRRIAGATMDSQGRRGGGSWAFLKPDTIRRKARMGLDPRIERATGLLYESLTRAGHPDQIATISRSGAALGSALPYSKAQSRGTRTLPSRPLVKVTDYDKNRIGRMVLEYIVS